jgi:ectoine hydroxylase-related dioxygenase (phytanoyl-CoA dioxygenase family)
MTGGLREDEVEAFRRDGFLRAGRVASAAEMKGIADRIDAALIRPKYPDVHRHLDNRTVYDLCAHPAIVERVASILGPDVIVWHSRVFHKRVADPAIPWHQDGEYWRLEPLVSVSVWIAIERADRGNGCVDVIPGSHRTRVPHRRDPTSGRFARHADLEAVDASRAVAMELDPGEFFLFDTWLLHSSAVNTSDRPRTALSVRYTTPEVAISPETLSPAVPGYGVQLVRGCDALQKNAVAHVPD